MTLFNDRFLLALIIHCELVFSSESTWSEMKLASVLIVALVIAVSADEYHPKHNRQGAYENRAVVDGIHIFIFKYYEFEILKCLILDAAYWNKIGQQLLQDELSKQRINVQAKNIIFFLGDGNLIPKTKKNN